jgi:hypothetical protein
MRVRWKGGRGRRREWLPFFVSAMVLRSHLARQRVGQKLPDVREDGVDLGRPGQREQAQQGGLAGLVRVFVSVTSHAAAAVLVVGVVVPAPPGAALLRVALHRFDFCEALAEVLRHIGVRHLHIRMGWT